MKPVMFYVQGMCAGARLYGHVGKHVSLESVSSEVGSCATLGNKTNLQEEERDLPLRTEFHEVCTLDGRLREEDAIVRDNANGHSVKSRKSCNERCAVQSLEFVEPRPINKACNHLPDIEGFLQVTWHNATQLHGIV